MTRELHQYTPVEMAASAARRAAAAAGALAAAAAAAIMLAGAPVRAAVHGACNYTVDSQDPVHGMVRAGNDMTCVAMPRNASRLADCAGLCCATDGCTAYSYNHPWNVGPYLQCDDDTEFCCCLKDGVPMTEPNKWPMNITSGLVPPRPFRCNASDPLTCNLNGDCAAGACVYASRAVQFHPHGGQSDFVWLSARTPHGVYVW